MKNVLFFAALLLGMMAYSCQKESLPTVVSDFTDLQASDRDSTHGGGHHGGGHHGGGGHNHGDSTHTNHPHDSTHVHIFDSLHLHHDIDTIHGGGGHHHHGGH